VNRPPSSPPCVASSRPRGMGSLLSGPLICERRRSKHLRAEGGPPSSLSWQTPPVEVTSDHVGEGDAFLQVGEREMGSTLSAMPSKLQNCRPPWPWYPRSPLGNPVPSTRRSVPRAVCHHLPGTCVWHAMGLPYSLPLHVVALGIRWFFEQETHFGSIELSPFSGPARAPDAFICK
jgi:hypothetical protein